MENEFSNNAMERVGYGQNPLNSVSSFIPEIKNPPNHYATPGAEFPSTDGNTTTSDRKHFGRHFLNVEEFSLAINGEFLNVLHKGTVVHKLSLRDLDLKGTTTTENLKSNDIESDGIKAKRVAASESLKLQDWTITVA
jgi:hypothetical protein